MIEKNQIVLAARDVDKAYEKLINRLFYIATKRFCLFRARRLFVLHRRLNALCRVYDELFACGDEKAE